MDNWNKVKKSVLKGTPRYKYMLRKTAEKNDKQFVKNAVHDPLLKLPEDMTAVKKEIAGAVKKVISLKITYCSLLFLNLLCVHSVCMMSWVILLLRILYC